MEYHKEYLARLGKPIQEAWEFDFRWCIHNGPFAWKDRGRVTDLGHAAYAADGSDQRQPAVCPFEDVEEVFAFDPFKEYGIPEHGELVRFFEDWYRETQADAPDQVVTGGRYITWTSGPFMDPDLYRGVIFPLYERMWAPLRRAGKKVLFCCDGTFSMFMDDIAAAGADGFIFEPSNDFEWVVDRFGSTHCLVGSKVDCRTMAFKPWEAVKAEMDDTFRLAKRCKGLIWAVGNHIPANVPDAMCDRYMNYLRANWSR